MAVLPKSGGFYQKGFFPLVRLAKKGFFKHGCCTRSGVFYHFFFSLFYPCLPPTKGSRAVLPRLSPQKSRERGARRRRRSAENSDPGEWSDVWSVGVIAFYLHGKLPAFQAGGGVADWKDVSGPANAAPAGGFFGAGMFGPEFSGRNVRGGMFGGVFRAVFGLGRGALCFLFGGVEMRKK